MSVSPCITNSSLHVAVTWAVVLSCKQSQAALRFSAVNKPRAVARANLFLQKEQVGTEQFRLLQESRNNTEGKSPGSEISLCAGHAFGKPQSILMGGRWGW